jgi:hypothetical protein
MMLAKGFPNLSAEALLMLDLSSDPNTQLNNPPELFWVKTPPRAVARGTCWQVVVYRMRTARAVCKDMIGVPIVAFNHAAANVATPTRLAQNCSAFWSRQSQALRPFGAARPYSGSPRKPEFV